LIKVVLTAWLKRAKLSAKCRREMRPSTWLCTCRTYAIYLFRISIKSHFYIAAALTVITRRYLEVFDVP